MHSPTKPLCMLALILAIGLMPSLTFAQTPDPIFVSGNPDCGDLGFAIGFKPQPEPPPTATYIFISADGVFTGLTAEDPSNSLTITSNGTFFDWTSTLAIDAVIVKGGPNTNVYNYNPESLGSDGLHSPINPNNNTPFAISHIEFCYDYEVGVNKTAETSFTRTFDWTIDKSVSPDTWDLFSGDSGTSKYTVSVEKTGFTDSDWAVSGEIWIDNATPFDATIEDVSDAISDLGAVAVDCGVSFPHTLPAGESLHCTYSTALTDGSNRTNTATVETSGIVGGDDADADVVFGDPTTTVNDQITVNDTNDESWMFSDSGSEMYDRTFTCDDDAGTHDNTATIAETGQNASASVTVECFEITVEKDAVTTFTRTWGWTIDKTASETDLTLSPGQVFLVTYWVNVDATATDNDHIVSGEIWINNPHPNRAAVLTGVSDVVSPAIAANVNCPSLEVPPSGSLHCSYDAALPDGSDRTNTATATQQNFAYDAQGNGVPSGTTDASGEAAVAFGDPTVETDECVDVNDTNVGLLGTVCADQASADFHYTQNVGPFQDPDDCGENLVVNTASFVTNDTGASGDDTWTIRVDVPCEAGCTLTQGYWKTHSQQGPAPYDNAWGNLGLDEENTQFFDSGQTYYEVLWTPPKGGNAWYILAHQYIAATLNVLNGASSTDVATALTDAEALLMEYDANGPKTNGKNLIPKNSSDRALAITLYSLLDAYNNGDIGPGHCDEDGSSGTPRVVSSEEPIETLEATAPETAEAEAIEAEATEAEAAEVEATEVEAIEPEAFETEAEVPTKFSVTNYPNPFNPATTLRIDLPEAIHVRLTVYDVLGRVVARLANGTMEAGVHTVTWNASGLPSGTYLYRLETPQGSLVQTMQLVK